MGDCACVLLSCSEQRGVALEHLHQQQAGEAHHRCAAQHQLEPRGERPERALARLLLVEHQRRKGGQADKHHHKAVGDVAEAGRLLDQLVVDVLAGQLRVCVCVVCGFKW